MAQWRRLADYFIVVGYQQDKDGKTCLVQAMRIYQTYGAGAATAKYYESAGLLNVACLQITIPFLFKIYSLDYMHTPLDYTEYVDV